MYDVVGNLHLHTTASDGSGTHDEVASAAVRAGLDFIIYTDHNTWTNGVEGWYHDSETGRDVLRLMGQEVNDQNLEPERNHLLCHFVCSDLNGVAAEPQDLIETVTGRGGLTFLAHPIEFKGHRDVELYPWVSWDISGFTGVELWNAMTNVKYRLKNVAIGLLGSYLPNWVLSGPFPEMLAKWDELLANGEKVVAIGNSDAHAMPITWKIFTRTIYPYEFCFRAVNTHLLLTEPLEREVDRARRQIYNALKSGRCFVSYDMIASPTGFIFTGASGSNQEVMMGDTLTLQSEAVLRVHSPHKAKLRLLKDGKLLKETRSTHLEWRTTEPGVYRVEAYRRYWGQQRGWVFTNPIYIKKGE